MKNIYLVIFMLIFSASAIKVYLDIKNEIMGVADDRLTEIETKTNELIALQKELRDKITEYDSKIDSIDNNISNIKNQKIIIKEFYHEKINSIDTFSGGQLDTFFTDRYR